MATGRIEQLKGTRNERPFQLRLAGYSPEQIREAIDCAVRRVTRRLELVPLPVAKEFCDDD